MAEAITLGALLPARLDDLAGRSREALSQNPEVGGMKLAWDYVGDQLQDALKLVLNCPAIDALAGAWSTARVLAEYADPAKHPPGERNVVELGDHQFTREFNPVISVTIGSCPCMDLEFALAVSASFGGLKLSVGDGHIIGGATGDAWASGQLSLQGVPLHQPAESKKLALPGTFELRPPGVPIIPGRTA